MTGQGPGCSGAPGTPVSPYFHEPGRPSPAALRTAGAAEVARRLRTELAGLAVPLDEPLPAQPFVLPRRTYDELFGVTRAMLSLVRRAVLALGATWPARLAALEADPEDHPLLSGLDNTETDHCTMMARADIVVGESGPRLLDLRVGGAFEGPHETPAFAAVWRRTHAVDGRSPFTGHDPSAARTASFEDVCARRGLPRSVAVLGRAPDAAGPGQVHERDLEQFRSRGFRAGFFEPGALPGALGRPGRLRYALGLCRPAPAGWSDAEVEALRDAQRAGLLLLPPQSSGLLANRRALALVSEGLPWMTRGERLLVERWLPWTRISVAGRTWRDGRECELPGLLLRDREQFVLKRAVGVRGRSALVGRHTAASEWRQEVERAFWEGDCVAQEYVEPASCPLEFTDGTALWTSQVTPVLSPMLFGGRPGGCLARYVHGGSAAVARNAVLTWKRDGARL